MSETAQKTEEREAHIQRAQYSIHSSPLGRAERSILPIRHSPLHKNDKPQPHRFISPKGEAHKRLFPAIFLFYPQKRTIPLSHSEENV